MDLTNQNFFLAHLKAVSQKDSIHTVEEIQDSNGKKLLDRNELLEPQKLQKLSQAQLKKPIYACIRFMEPLTMAAIRLHMQKAMDQSPGARLFERTPQGQQVALECLNRVTLPLPLLNLLTIMSKRLPELYTHSLEVTLICTYIGTLHRMPFSELVNLMYVGLFHDIGSMFLSPHLLDREGKLSWSDWRQIYTHPTLSYTILKDVQGLSPHVLAAVRQHHERIDGSGYPQGLTDKKLGELGRVAASAELIASVAQHKSQYHLTTVLNANIGKLDPAVLDTMAKVLAGIGSDDAVQASDNAAIYGLIDVVNDALARWQSIDPPSRAHRALEKVANGLSAVERIVNESELSADKLAPHDADAMVRLKLSQKTIGAIEEAKYQLLQVLQDVHRNKATYMAIEPEEISKALGRWVAETDRRFKGLGELAAAAAANAEPSQTNGDASEAASDNKEELLWYCMKNGKKHGPLSALNVMEFIQKGELRPVDLVWRAGLSHWSMVRTVPELFNWDTKLAEKEHQ
ncbi:HD domain-containing phosphohydrolase [Methylogaea oryzae]|uniref:HD-GYP domain-containing protein n=2 Tax=Methylogaea oryzae TaxID=1295382 RepID=A0A8D4VRK9_9GAMM|nr:HD domain-containing phosphohydrolase [Methylogaea oryzae]BBL72009.1 hypothetical protein MoryE10_26150 [Methylogaea oryzae]